MTSDNQTKQHVPTQPETPRPQPQRANRRRARWWMGGLVAVGLIGAVFASTVLPSRAPESVIGPIVTHTVTRGDLAVTVTEQGTLESANNREIKCKVRGNNTIIWVVESGTQVKPGDVLLRLDTLMIEEEISERTKFAHLARAAVERSHADVVRAELAISEYLEGRYVAQLASLEKELAVAESRFRSVQSMLAHAKMMSKSGYVSELDVEEKQFAVTQADLGLKLINTRINVLKQFTRAEQLATLRGEWKATKAQYEADKERQSADEMRLTRAEDELEQCVVQAEASGLVIYPSARQWEEAPEIEEGATVHKDQVLLLMPDLSQMQVKVGIHESLIDRVTPGLKAQVTLPERMLKAEVSSVAAVARPAGWWTGNVVKYDTIVKVPRTEGLKPGMTAEVEVVLARYQDVLMIPTGAVVATSDGYACWVQAGGTVQRRKLELGDNNDMYIVVKSGVKQDDKVVLDPLNTISEAQAEAAVILEHGKYDKTHLSEI